MKEHVTMKKVFWCLLFILVLTMVLVRVFALPEQEGQTSRTVYLVGGRLIDGTGGETIENSLVIIEGNQIIYAGRNDASVKMSLGKKIDCTGKTILPGLFDSHVHLRAACTLGYIPINVKRKLKGFLYCGVTSIFDLASIEDWIFTLREKGKTDRSLSPHLFAVGPCFTSPEGHGTEYGVPMAVTPTTEEEARLAVRQLAPKKPDYIKIIYEKGSKRFSSLSYELMETIIDEAHRNHLKVVTHISTLEHARDAVKAGTDGLAHMVTDEEVDEVLLQDMKNKNVFCMPTLAVYEALSRLVLDQEFLRKTLVAKGVCREIMEDVKEKCTPEVFSKNASRRNKRFLMAKSNLKKMAEAGVTIVTGTDAGNPMVFFGPSVHREMELMVEAGLSPLQVITSSTRNAAEILGQNYKTGTIARGKLADILIVKGNPLEDISATQDIFMVIKDGVVLDRTRLAEMINPPARPPVSSMDRPALFDDFEDGDVKTGWSTGWMALSDKVAGGSSISNIRTVLKGADNSKHSLHIFGEVTTKFQYGFAGATAPLGEEAEQFFDVSQYHGLKFKTRGDGKTYRLVFTTKAVRDYDDFFHVFSTSSDWKEIVVPFSDLRQFGFGKKVEWTAKDVQAIEIMTLGSPYDEFGLYIDDITFYSESATEEKLTAPKTARALLQRGINNWIRDDIQKAEEMFQQLDPAQNDFEMQYDLARTRYNLCTWHMVNKQKDKASEYIDKAIETLLKSIELNKDFSDSHALLGSAYGMKIGLSGSFFAGFKYGPKASRELERALRLNPDNPRALCFQGISKLKTPRLFGGSLE